VQPTFFMFEDELHDFAREPSRIFTDPRIAAWRTLHDRQNCTLQLAHRFHIKRYSTPLTVMSELRGYSLLKDHGIPTAPLVAAGVLPDRRSFTMFLDLEGYLPGDRFLADRGDFAPLINPTASLAARLHSAGLHHRDLYLCHFMIRAADLDVRLIDAARVRRLPRFLRTRWIVKDVAQFLYSTHAHESIQAAHREQWLQTYEALTLTPVESMRSAIERKVKWIARHDRRLRTREPKRNISLPT
jgi:hypothetical protein